MCQRPLFVSLINGKTIKNWCKREYDLQRCILLDKTFVNNYKHEPFALLYTDAISFKISFLLSYKS